MRLGLAIAALVAVLDQLTKQMMMGWLGDPFQVVEVTGFFNLVTVWNRGVSFGMFNAAGDVGPWILSLVAIAVSIALGVWLRRAESRLLAVALGLVIGGALGNVVDRAIYGAVYDFLDLHAFGYHWPAFNLADSAITAGVIGILLDGLFERRKEPM
ncbi:MAG: signal peptidase II [Alphaproteobacteria bacterium]